MAIGDIIHIEIEGIAAGGAGVAHRDGRTYFVELSAPGDVAAVRIVEERANWSKAELVAVEKPSPDRLEPQCRHYGECGGCALQHLSYEAQLREKKRILEDSLRRIGGFSDLPEIRVVPSEPFGYRNRMQFHRVPKCAAVGLMGRKNDRVVRIEECPVAVEELRRTIESGSLSVPPWTDRFNVYARGAVLLAEGSATERGAAEVLGKKLKLDVKGFFQSNGAALEELVKDVVDSADGADRSGRAIDLYCGIGTFGAFLADIFGRIDLVERDKTALAIARENVKGPGMRHFALSDDEWTRAREGREERYAFAVVDPPRVGLSAPLRKWLLERPPQRLVYVSCDAATLARDSKELVGGGYSLTALSFHDFYPQTPHLESLAVLEGPR